MEIMTWSLTVGAWNDNVRLMITLFKFFILMKSLKKILGYSVSKLHVRKSF